MKPNRPRAIKEYLRKDNSSPYREWLVSLNVAVQARIQARVFRFESGNLGDHKPVGEGVWEARFDIGPGYRLYFAFDGADIILLLVGGDKKSQRKDIKLAQQHWKEYTDAQEK